MQRWTIYMLLWLGSFPIPAQLIAQGSGDAGLQSSGDFDSRSRLGDTPSRIYFLQNAGMGPGNSIHLTSEVQLDWNIWGGINLWFSVPYQFTTGDLATVHGVGDLRLVLNHTLAEAGDFVVKLNIGGVIPSGYADKETEGKPLPMAYQNSQGAASFLVSAVFYYRHWSLSSGYQRVVSGNSNRFTKAGWGDAEQVKEFADSPGLWRGDDLGFRIRKEIDRPKANYSLSLLPAFRLMDDRILEDGKLVPVAGSSGFFLNVSAGVEARLGKLGYFHFLAAVPIVQRDAYPDGLKRSFLIQAGFGVQFPE